MSGRSYKKVRKDDKNKKKLKTALKNVATKTKLPKGQNLTDTNFKVKKIVIKDQVKPHDPDEILYRKKLNVVELAARLGHHNSSIKHEALDGLRNLVTYHPLEVLESNYIQVLEATVKLVLDETASVRKSACKIVSQILAAVAETKLIPFFPSLNSYLLCGLTHIDRGVREDSLVLMDACLKHVPELCERYALNLLSVCLDLISEKGIGSRTLSLNLESAHVVTKWRTKVLERIYALLECLIKSTERTTECPSGASKKSDLCFTPGDTNFFPIYTTCIFNLSEIGAERNECSDSGSLKSSLVEYAEAIIPLLMGMFLEVHPIDKNASETGLSTAINEDSSKLLNLVVGIMHYIWVLIDLNSEHKKSFEKSLSKFSNSLLQTIVFGRFPYSVASKGSGGQQKMSAAETTTSISLNLAVTRLVLLYTRKEHWDYVIPFLKNCFRITDQLSASDASVFAECVSKICYEDNCSDNEYFFDKAVEISLKGNSMLSSHFFKLLGSTALNPTMSRYHQNPVFEKWLASLPERATRNKIHPYQMDIISQIAVRGFTPFLSNLDISIELILDNIPKVIVDEGRQVKVQRQMATLLHWVQDWDEELTESLQSAIDSCYWGDRLTKFISEIIAVKSNSSSAE